ncbi:MAG: Type I Iterative PKS [Chrysothrix sp. TS-e1954]|nr:MAG: Type I Iterative PKS [Chrysothrix sp. TS-e1954]
MPSDRLDLEAHYHPDVTKPGLTNVKGGSFLHDEDIAFFDAAFFNLSANEAKALDPQHRLLLECTYEALENAGIPMQEVCGTAVGVFMGGSQSDYEAQLRADALTAPRYLDLGVAMSMFANRISHVFDFRGPSITVDTACSSSLSAFHLACQSIKAGECDAAIVGGSCLHLLPDTFASMSSLGLLGPDGRCFSFDQRASGFGRGEGAACLALKPLKAAIEAGDSVRAVVRATGINQDGRTPGITMPSGLAQEQLMHKVYKSCGLEPRHTDFVEMHGTGTLVGDPIEARAVAKVFGHARETDNPVCIGSVKSNFGFVISERSFAAVLKKTAVILRVLVTLLPNADFQEANQNIPLEDMNLKACDTWQSSNTRRASISNFGFGGSNAHIILEEYDSTSMRQASPESLSQPVTNGGFHSSSAIFGPSADARKLLIPLSGWSEASLRSNIRTLWTFLETQDDKKDVTWLNRLAHTLGHRRSHFPWRCAIATTDKVSLRERLDPAPYVQRASEAPRIGFVFTGQGAQWAQMGRELMHYPIFASRIEAADRHLTFLGADWSLQEELALDSNSSRLGQAYISQAACTALQLALVELLHSWAISPVAVVGHSSGEIAAAYAAGAVDFETAIALAYFRGQISSSLTSQEFNPQGSMVAVGANEQIVDSLIEDVTDGELTIACYNSPYSHTVSGDACAIDQLLAIAKDRDVFARKLKVDVAYHSHHMATVADEYRGRVAHYTTSEGAEQRDVQFHSSVTGREMQKDALKANYWVTNLTAPVQFVQGIKSLCSHGSKAPSGSQPSLPVDFLLEIGPHGALGTPIKQILQTLPRDSSRQETGYAALLQREKNDVSAILEAVTALYMRGLDVDFSRINLDRQSQSVSATPLTDLPPYEWDKSRQWHDSRLSKEHRYPQMAWNVMLGQPGRGSVSSERTFRNVFKVDDIPWLAHHRINGDTIFSMAGYISMAVEAICNVTSEKENPQILIRETSISRALIISLEPETDMTLVIRPAASGTRGIEKHWHDFRIWSWSESTDWVEHCRGLIRVVEAKDPNPVDGEVVKTTILTSNMLSKAASLSKCSTERDVQEQYDWLSKGGLQYGETFRGMRRLRTSVRDKAHTNGTAVATIEIQNTEQLMPEKYENLLRIHPSALDAFLHPVCSLVGGDPTERLTPHVPTFIGELSIGAGWATQKGKTVDVYVHQVVRRAMSRHASASLDAYDESLSPSEPVVSINGLELVALESDQTLQPERVPPGAHSIAWRAHPDLLSETQLKDILSLQEMNSEETQIITQMRQASLFYLRRALKQVELDNIANVPAHLRNMYAWMRTTVDAEKSAHHQDPSSSETDNEEDVQKQLKPLGPVGEFITSIGTSLPAILQQNVDPLSLMLSNDLLTQFYENELTLKRAYARSSRFVGLLGHQNPEMKVLEIGAGTGSATLHLLNALSDEGATIARCTSYDFTDISTGFFETARERFSKWRELMNFRKLDVAEDINSQGYEEGSYDLIVASNVLHATPNIRKTLSNVKRLLRPNGKLMLVELITQRVWDFPFTSLPGWWSSEEDYRRNGPHLSEKQWEEALREESFSGVDVSMAESAEGPHRTCSLIISTALEQHKNPPMDVSIVCDQVPDVLSQGAIQGSLATLAQQEIEVYNSIELKPHRKICICLDEMNAPVLTHMTTERFAALKDMFSHAKGVLWVTCGSSSNMRNADLNFVQGFVRALRLENASLKAVTLSLGSVTNSLELINQVFEHCFVNNKEAQGCDLEYVEVDGLLQVPRLVPCVTADSYLLHEIDDQAIEDAPYRQSDRSLSLTIGHVGLYDSLYFENNDILERPLEQDELLLEVLATGMNFKDVMVATGTVPWTGLGLECCGKVLDVGPQTSGIVKGDRVCHWSTDKLYATHARTHTSNVVKAPECLTNVQVASLPIVYLTAYVCLIDYGHLEAGESILIHAASGGVGQAAIMLAKMVGATVYATVGTVEKKKLVCETYGIPEDHIFSSRDVNFKTTIMRMTGRKGVDMVLNSLTGEALKASWDCVADFGRFMEIGKRDLQSNSYLEMQPFLRNISYTGVDIGPMFERKPQYLKRTMEKVMLLMDQSLLSAVTPVTVFSTSALEQGFRTMQAGKHMGKIVVAGNEHDKVKARKAKDESAIFKTDATYVITGGTGGLGRSLVRWMTTKGARNFILASRSPTTPAVQELMKDLAAVGARIEKSQCDVADAAQVRNLDPTKYGMPTTRGVIHGALVLQDTLFENSTFEQWDSIVRTKVEGAWNLHNLMQDLKADLDFFICLSSDAGIAGNEGQATYAGSSTFLDAFSQYRASLGLPATTLDLPAIIGVGYAAERMKEDSAMKKHLEQLYSEYATENEFLALFKGAVTGKLGGPETGHQSIIGMRPTPGLLERPLMQDAKFSYLRRMAKGTATGALKKDTFTSLSLSESLKDVKDDKIIHQLIFDGIAGKFSSIMMIPLEDITPTRPFGQYGLDSLVAVEFRNWINRETDAGISMMELLNMPTLQKLVETLMEKSPLVSTKTDANQGAE